MSTEEAPSIGSVNINFDPSGQRVRQIIETPIAAPAELTEALEKAHMYAEETGATRTVVRALVPSNNIDLPNGFTTEATIPISDRGLYFSYFGYNRPERNSTVINEEMDLLATVRERPVKAPADVLRDAEARGFRFERLQGEVSEEDFARLVEMYEASFDSYPFDIKDEIASMISRPSTHVYAARSTQDGQLYAVAATEQVVLDAGNGSSFTMREMGDSAKMPVNRDDPSGTPQSTGLNAPIKLLLIAEAARDGVDMVFCESRAALGAVNAINHDIGMQHCGLLPKHTVISGPATINEVERDGANGQYGNLHVWAVNNAQIRYIGAEVEAYYAPR